MEAIRSLAQQVGKPHATAMWGPPTHPFVRRLFILCAEPFLGPFSWQLQAGYLPLPDPLPSERPYEHGGSAEGSAEAGRRASPSGFAMSVSPSASPPIRPSSGELMNPKTQAAAHTKCTLAFVHAVAQHTVAALP